MKIPSVCYMQNWGLQVLILTAFTSVTFSHASCLLSSISGTLVTILATIFSCLDQAHVHCIPRCPFTPIQKNRSLLA